MAAPFLHELPYTTDGAQLFGAVAHEPWAMFLDSGPEPGRLGRVDIIVARPVATVISREGQTVVEEGGGVTSSLEDPLAVLRWHLPDGGRRPAEVPFAGGALGYFGYDLAWRLEPLATAKGPDHGFPEMAVGLYNWAVVVDHGARRCWLAGGLLAPVPPAEQQALLELFSDPGPRSAQFCAVGPVLSEWDEGDYERAFRRVQSYLREGDCYQVNLARRWSVPVAGDPWAGFQALRQINPAPFSAYLNFPFGQILSCSPERFLRLCGGRVETRPIKGTRPRSEDPEKDRSVAEELSRSTKDRAENVMIVDLLRNDLGRSCAVGSVQVPELFKLESFATVHHLVSTVTGRLGPGEDALSLLRACFPGGSITGAPKRRAMEIIEELEAHRRGVYCGAIGYVGADGEMDTSIAIRTATLAEGILRFWAGGGVVIDSECQAEYRETLDKAAAFLRFCEAIS